MELYKSDLLNLEHAEWEENFDKKKRTSVQRAIIRDARLPAVVDEAYVK